MTPNLEIYKDMQALLAKMNANELRNGGSRFYIPSIFNLMNTISYFRTFVLTPEEITVLEAEQPK